MLFSLFVLHPLLSSVSASAAVSSPLLVNLVLKRTQLHKSSLDLITLNIETDLEVWLPFPVPIISAATSIAVSPVEFSSQLATDGFEMHEVAEARSGALPGLILAATGLSEICHGCELCVDWATSKPAIVEISTGFQSVLKSSRTIHNYTSTAFI